MFERFSDDARRVVVLAQEEARLLSHDYIGTEHLLLGLTRAEAGVVFDAFRYFELTHEAVRARVEEIIGLGGTEPSGHIPFTPRAKKVLELSLREAMTLGDTDIGSEHILLGLTTEGTGVASRVLEELGAELTALREKVLDLRGDGSDRPHVEFHAAPPSSMQLRRAVARGRPAGWSGPRAVPRCSMCGRDEARCEHMLVAGGMRICADCARSAAAQLEALPADAPKLVRYRRAEFAPSDKDAAIAAIERAFDAVIGPLHVAPADALWAIEGGEEALPLLEQLDQDSGHAPVVVNDQTIERVRFLDEGEAEISLGIWIAGSNQPVMHPAHAVLEGGTWKVRRSSVEHFAQLAHQFRRPPGP